MSHKFTVEIELEDAKSCKGCPCFKDKHGGGFSTYTYPGKVCALGHFEWIDEDQSEQHPRPQACVDRYGSE